MESANVAIESVESVGPDTIAVTLDAPPNFEARPGQFVKLSATVDDEHVSRFYTLSSPGIGDTFEITVGVDPDGSVGPWLRDAVGEVVRIEGPFGTAAYDSEDRILVIAGGPGVGPAVGIGERAVSDGGDVAIVYRDAEPAHRDRLQALEEAGATVVVTDGSIEHHVDELLENRQVYVYGFQSFVNDAVAAIRDAGGDPDTAKIENFG